MNLLVEKQKGGSSVLQTNCWKLWKLRKERRSHCDKNIQPKRKPTQIIGRKEDPIRCDDKNIQPKRKPRHPPKSFIYWQASLPASRSWNNFSILSCRLQTQISGTSNDDAKKSAKPTKLPFGRKIQQGPSSQNRKSTVSRRFGFFSPTKEVSIG